MEMGWDWNNDTGIGVVCGMCVCKNERYSVRFGLLTLYIPYIKHCV